MTGPAGGPGAQAVARALVDGFDWGHFEFSSAPGVPQPRALAFLLAAGLRLGDPQAERAALVGLDALVKSEACDGVEGGFFARCATRGWRDPVPEKPLVLNARMAGALALAGRATAREDFARAASETAAWVDRALSRPSDDLWSDGQSADPGYYARMATARSRRPPARPGEAAPVGACALTASVLAVVGAIDENRSLVARARLALQSLLDRAGAGRAGWAARVAAPDGVALASALIDVGGLTGDRTLEPPLAELLGTLRASADVAPGDLALVRLRQARRVGATARGDLRLADPAAAGPPDPAVAAPEGAARLAAEAGVIAVEGVAGSSLVSGAFAACAPYGPLVVVDTSGTENDENRVAVVVPGRAPAVARRRSELGSVVEPLRPPARKLQGLPGGLG